MSDIETKRCKPTSKAGCNLVLPLGDFTSRLRYRSDGSARRSYCSWCRTCQARREVKLEQELDERARLRALQAALSDGQYEKRRKLKHSGPVDHIDRLFYCVIPPTDSGKLTENVNSPVQESSA